MCALFRHAVFCGIYFVYKFRSATIVEKIRHLVDVWRFRDISILTQDRPSFFGNGQINDVCFWYYLHANQWKRRESDWINRRVMGKKHATNYRVFGDVTRTFEQNDVTVRVSITMPQSSDPPQTTMTKGWCGDSFHRFPCVFYQPRAFKKWNNIWIATNKQFGSFMRLFANDFHSRITPFVNKILSLMTYIILYLILTALLVPCQSRVKSLTQSKVMHKDEIVSFTDGCWDMSRVEQMTN